MMEVVNVSRDDDGKNAFVTCRVSMEDMAKIVALFKSGKLAELGVTDIDYGPLTEDKVVKGYWTGKKAQTNAEREKGRESPG